MGMALIGTKAVSSAIKGAGAAIAGTGAAAAKGAACVPSRCSGFHR